MKPQNIMLTPRGQVKVLDFGLAKSITPINASKSETETLNDVRDKGLVAGTVAYMSPEQARGRELDVRTDLFSLAVVLFEMTTGVSSFRRTTAPLTFDAILNSPPTSPRQINPKLPTELECIILKGLAKDRDLRYQSASELLADLERLQRDLQVGPSTKAAPLARRTRRHLGYVLAGLVVAAVVATFGLSKSEAPSSAGERPPYVHLLFSEIKRGLHMAIVTGTERRSEVRDVYVPPTDRMAHRSNVSPDRRWVLIASEMNASGWFPCRLVPMDGSLAGRIVGPPRAKCTYAAWSPDGQWMYFSAESGGGFHTWRQKFSDGTPEQITFGATDEEGIALWPDGRSFASSVGTTVSSIWVRDAGNERQITSEGYGHLPSFSADGTMLYYLLRVSGVQQFRQFG